MKAFVSRVSRNGKGNATLLTLEGEFKAYVDSQLQEGNFVEGHTEGKTFVVENQWSPDEDELKQFQENLERSVSILGPSEFKNADVIARKLKVAGLLNRQAVMRFHNDADGISSAVILSNLFQSYKQQQNTPSYSQRDAFYDLMSLRYGTLPLLVVVDFGSSSESFDGYDIIRAEGVEIIVIDHHPCEEEVKEKATVLNPLCEGKTGEYSAGYLCNEVAKLLGKDFDFLAKVSLAGDKSTLPYGEEHKKAALALDYAAFYTGYGNVFSLYKEILSDEGLRETIYQKARDKLDVAKATLLKQVKSVDLGKLKFYYFDADAVGERREFPPTGKLATLLSEMLEEDAVIMAYTGRMVSLRVSRKGLLDLSKLVDLIKQRLPAVEGGGGHANAASFRIRDPSMKEAMISPIVDLLKEFLSSAS